MGSALAPGPGHRASFKDVFSLLQNPPNFLRASALSEHISPVVVIPAEVSSPDSEPVLEKDDLMDMDASQQVETDPLREELGPSRTDKRLGEAPSLD